MKRHLLLFMVATLRAATIYDNTSADSGDSVLFSVGPYSEIGDRVLLGGAERAITRATVEFYNGGTAGNFDALLRLYHGGAPVGASLTSAFALTGIAAPGLSVFSLTFDTLGLIAPDDLVFTVEVQNVDAGMDLGLNLYNPPGSVGSSSSSFLIVRGSSFSEQAAGVNSNLYFRLEADLSGAPVPEPSTALLTAVGGLLLVRHRRARFISNMLG